MPKSPMEHKSRSDIAREHAARRDAAPAVALLVVTQGSLIWLDPSRPTNPAEIVWALSPLAAISWLVWGQIRAVGRADELQRLQQLQALSIGFAVLIVLLTAIGLLHAAEIGEIAQQTQIALIAGVLAWVGASAVLSARSR
ncbi:MAG: hypothetical protein ACKVWR_04405 [Acidimicrobiales bacterium]